MKNPRYIEIRRQIRQLKKDMKADGIRVVSCMNAGLDRATYSCNRTLFALNTELLKTPSDIS